MLLLEPGSVFARDFKVIRHLASGGMGQVYVVEQLSTGKQRALKVMHAQLAEDARHRERFESEARMAGRIESDHVVDVLAAGVDEKTGLPWLAMELLRGATLDELVEREGPRSWAQATEIARQLRHVLERAHEQGLVHRDLKPENIMLATARREGIAFTAKILDFGIAKWVQEARGGMRNSMIIGSPLWMAPEQLTPGEAITGATDVWALGLIFFYLLTGKSYWKAANLEESSVSALLVEVALNPMPPPSERAKEFGAPGRLPPGFDAWFAKASTRARAERYPEGGAALAAFVTMMQSAETQAASELAAEPTVRTGGPSSAGVVTAEDATKKTMLPDVTHLPAPARLPEREVSSISEYELPSEPPTEDPEEAERSLRLARVFEMRDSDRDRAIRAYRKVLSLNPGSVEAHRGLAALYRRAELRAELIELLVHELAHVALTPAERAGKHLEIGELKEREGDLEGAATGYRSAMEADPRHLRASEALIDHLARQGAVEAAITIAEEAAVNAGARGDDDARFALLCKVADLKSSRDRISAVDALRRAAQIRPDSVEVRARVASLYARDPESDAASARERWIEVLSLDLRHLDAWRALLSLAQRSGSIDELWCVSDAAVAVLGDDAPGEAAQVLAQHTPPRARGERIDEAGFATLAGNELDRPISTALAKRLDRIRKSRERPLASLGLSIREVVDPTTSSRALLNQAMPVYRALLAAGNVLDVPAIPQLYYRSGSAPGLTFLQSTPSAILSGHFEGWKPEDLAFAAAEHIAFLRPELEARLWISDDAQLFGELSGEPDITVERCSSWRRGAELVAARAALLISRDLRAARRVLSVAPPLANGVAPQDRFRDLALFAVSPSYPALRRALGLGFAA